MKPPTTQTQIIHESISRESDQLLGHVSPDDDEIVTEKFLPTVDSSGNSELDKIKARFCVDGRDQVRSDYRTDEIESPTASMAAIFTVAQLAAAEKLGDVGSAYLNANLPMTDPNKILHMIIESDVADEIIRQDKSFGKYRTRNGNIIV